MCVCVRQSQLVKIQTEFTTERSSDKSLQLRITELLTTLEQRESVIRRQEEVRAITLTNINTSQHCSYHKIGRDTQII